MREGSPGDGARVRLLVSVRDAEEGWLAREAGADLIDAKDPTLGALGALPVEAVRALVLRLGAGATTSAVAGQEAAGEDGDALPAAIRAMAGTGVDYVKVALTPARLRDRPALAAAARAAPGRVIGVLFAEDLVAESRAGADTVPGLAAAGFSGAMIDTRGKAGRRLRDLLAPDTLTAFVAVARGHGLLCGLAGSLRPDDIPALAGLEPDYLGFRGGLCRGGDRRRGLDGAAVRAAAQALRGYARTPVARDLSADLRVRETA